MRNWFRNVYSAVATVLVALWVSMRYWLRTYDPKRKTFTEHYEYPELPVEVFPRYRGFHRYDLTSLHRLRAVCAGLPGRLHFDRQGACAAGEEGLSSHQLHDRLREVPFLRDLHRELPGRLHLHGLVLRPELLQPGRLHRRFCAAPDRSGLGPRNPKLHGGGLLEARPRTGPRRAEWVKREGLGIGD